MLVAKLICNISIPKGIVWSLGFVAHVHHMRFSSTQWYSQLILLFIRLAAMQNKIHNFFMARVLYRYFVIANNILLVRDTAFLNTFLLSSHFHLILIYYTGFCYILYVVFIWLELLVQ